jgi:hypothetical protein
VREALESAGASTLASLDTVLARGYDRAPTSRRSMAAYRPGPRVVRGAARRGRRATG